MASMLSLRRSSGMLGLAVAAVLAVGLQAGPAQASRVGPKQYFTGVINGKAGNTTIPIPIKIACSATGTTGHPLPGQTLAVHQLFPPGAGSLGYTGKDSRIGVFFTAPPPGGPCPGWRPNSTVGARIGSIPSRASASACAPPPTRLEAT